jgi:hypothetical protein
LNKSVLQDFPMDKEIFLKELEFVQRCIERMASNSFEIKKWAIGSMTILLSLVKITASSDCKVKAAGFIAIIALLIIFWTLDAYYLRLERKFRGKYNWLIQNRPLGNHQYLFNLDPEKSAKSTISKKLRKCMISDTVFPLYLGLLIFSVIIWGI